MSLEHILMVVVLAVAGQMKIFSIQHSPLSPLRHSIPSFLPTSFQRAPIPTLPPPLFDLSSLPPSTPPFSLLPPPFCLGFVHYTYILTKLAEAQEEAVKVLENLPEPDNKE